MFLEDAPDGPRPVWFACAAHDYSGDQLRRRWDDPFLVKTGDHPVIHAGAGSHAAYFEAGEYMTAAPIPGARRLHGILDAVRSFWRDTLRQPDPGDLAASLERALSIPFIDYARGDGVQLGGEGGEPWTPVLIDDSVPWVDGYRGLMGLDTFDRFAGERAPAGPKYTRSGTIRQSWNDPIGWAGLAKTAPPFRMPAALEARLAELGAELSTLRAENDAKEASLDGLDLEVRALSTDQSFAAIHAGRAAELAKREAEVNRGRTQEGVLSDSIRACRRELERLRVGDYGDPRAHLRDDHHPVPPEMTRYGRLIEVWSAISISLVLVGAVVLPWLTSMPWYVALLLAVAVYTVLEAAFRRRLTTLLLRSTLFLAAIGALIVRLRVHRADRDRGDRRAGRPDPVRQRSRDPPDLGPVTRWNAAAAAGRQPRRVSGDPALDPREAELGVTVGERDRRGAGPRRASGRPRHPAARRPWRAPRPRSHPVR